MATRTNARSVAESLDDGLRSDAKIIGSFAKVAGFAVAAASGEPLSLLAGIGKFTEAASAALEGASEVTRRLGQEGASGVRSTLSNYDRFKALFFTACAKSYIETIAANIDALTATIRPISKKGKRAPPKEECKGLRDKLENGIARLNDTDVAFLYGIQPLSGSVPLFGAYSEWLSVTLVNYGIDESIARQFASKCEKEARERFRAFIAGSDPVADWMRRYLAIYSEEQLSSIAEGLNEIVDTLNEWMEPQKELRKREEEAWANYRKLLQGLPDLKETMFNEQFGVRKVFVRPQATYHVAGGAGDAGKPHPSPDIARLLGALISTRTTGEDLIVLCGGPGSGKSTLCRILAAQLASNANVHPIFVRLRRLKEGSDIGAFIEDTLQKQGAISRLSDLREIPNLVVILDGFDELVMASRARLRQFFNVLREEHSTGALRGAKIIVSGRDTLFPQGEGLPNGSHIITLLPFDRVRVDAWGEKWRMMHAEGAGSTFYPSQFLDQQRAGPRGSSLHHLVTWPLTLHLVARVHTTGLLDLGKNNKDSKIEKAYLYRSILAETAQRQVGQADTAGRLAPEKMREFLRDLAWHMYSESKDSMDPSEVMPLLAKYFKDASDLELAELADVAVVNSPELSKGEETGFEFVHKSFSEYLVAERIAYSVEVAIFRAPSFGTEELTWRASDEEAIRELAPHLGTRLLTEEVQEMLEPMLGSFAPFFRGGRVSEIVSGKQRQAGLSGVIARFEGLYRLVVQGDGFQVVLSTVGKWQPHQNPLETFSNYAAGIVLIGSAAVRQLRSVGSSNAKERLFECNPLDGAFWRWICILHAGGLQLDRKLASRLYNGLSVRGREDRSIDDRSSPVRPGWLAQIQGYRPITSEYIGELIGTVQYMQIVLFLIAAYTSMESEPSPGAQGDRVERPEMERLLYGVVRDSVEFGVSRAIDAFSESGLISEQLREFGRPRVEYFIHSLRDNVNPEEVAYRLEHFGREFIRVSKFSHYGHSNHFVDLIRRVIERDPRALERITELFRRFR